MSQDKFGFFLRKRTTLAMESFLCTVAVVIIVTLSQLLPPYSRGADVADAGPGGGACYMMMEWRFLLPFCILQVRAVFVFVFMCCVAAVLEGVALLSCMPSLYLVDSPMIAPSRRR